MQLNQQQFILIKSANLKECVNDSFCEFLCSVYRDNNDVVLVFNLEALDSDLNALQLKEQCFFGDLTNLKNKTNQAVNNDQKTCTIAFKIDDKKLPIISRAEKFMGENGVIALPYSANIRVQMEATKQALNNQKTDLQLQISNIDLRLQELEKQIESYIKLNDEALKIQAEIDELNV